MLELNRAERRALLLGTWLLLAGCALRLGCGPDTAEYAWRPVSASGRGERPGLEEVRKAASEETRKARRAKLPLAPGERLDPNGAAPEELERLPGIGPALAARIVAARDSSGGFDSADDLLAVSGIGPKTLERIRPHLRLRRGPKR